MKSIKERSLKAKRIIGILSLLALLSVVALISYFVIYKFLSIGNSPQNFEAFIESYGWAGRFVALAIQFLQVFVALIPGEFVEVGLGLAFGAVEGTLICLIGVGVASAAVFALVKKWGVRFLELFINVNKIDSLKFINSEKKLNTLVFILFLIPGTPKDLLTYVVPLTRMKMSEFMFITMIARIPSVLSSTIGGDLFGSGKYLHGILLLVVTGAISLIGLYIYRKLLDKYHQKKKQKTKG